MRLGVDAILKRNGHNLDRILIKDLLLRCIIGVNESERREKQDVVINIMMWADLSEVAKTDDIRVGIDYKEVSKSVIKLVENSEFFLVEALAEGIARECLRHEGVSRVRVSVEKPGALRFSRSVGVEIDRERQTA